MLNAFKKLLSGITKDVNPKKAYEGHKNLQGKIAQVLGMNDKYGYKGIDRPAVPITEILRNGPQPQVPTSRLEFQTPDQDVTPKKFQDRGRSILYGQMRGGRPIGIGDAVPMPQFDMREPLLNREGTQLFGWSNGEYGPMYGKSGVDERILINGRRKKNIFEEI